ncbi:hypothetical protein [Donghicola mangrovi]|uniref:Uncharacterized protein n=1 Tax=Donghicola mangrovi TaxID=2729614 RepID=A0A850QGJ1_9RHOB|nr:hypothetical protein [Donghicola mangrovi]NVO25495.1 hypothetical protein [Donghicola mangrovi]
MDLNVIDNYKKPQTEGVILRVLIIFFFSIFLVGACGPTNQSRGTSAQLHTQKSQRAANLARNNAIWAQRRGYVVSGMNYEVGVSPDWSYALVAPIGQASFSLGEVETAASAVTGCAATGDSFLYLIGVSQGTRIPISALDKLSGRTRVELTC